MRGTIITISKRRGYNNIFGCLRVLCSFAVYAQTAWGYYAEWCEGLLTLQKKADFAIRTLQNEDILHFFTIKFAYIKKKQYLCIVIKKI